ncbi:uncharacterized protein [Dermacentor andersoni]|uniref:uncharacterized protein isoform X1 n=1 Tax=Dermacentor andersoni TaxID=34620 RepID=UPI002155EEA2|nr:uncharacterized protein LOC126521681 isoform X1 [Dermacentor andersoni]
MKACRSAVGLACVLVLVVEACCAVTFAEWRKNLMSVNPGSLQPQCKKVFKACNVKLISLVGVMEALKQHWEEYTAVPCVKGMLSRAFPDFSEECSMSGFYGNSIKCMQSPEAFAVIGKKQQEAVAPAFKCLIDNALP